MVAHNVLCHTNAPSEPRPMPTANTYVNVKRVFNTQPEVMGYVIYVGEVICTRMMKRPLMTCLLSLQAGLLLSFGVMMSCQVGGRWGSSTGVNNFVFAGFGIPFGLTFIVLCQGAELITANYMFCTFAVLAAKPEDRKDAIIGTALNWVVCWTLNLVGAILHFVIFAWQTGLIKTVAIKNDPLSDPTGALENIEMLYYESNQAFRDDFNGDFCSRSNYAFANMCKLIKAAKAKCTAHFTTSIIRGCGCNWMVCLAIWLQMIATEPISKFICIWLPIELFISSGFDHLVVNEFLIPGGIIVGATYYDDRANWGNCFWYNFVPVTLGSIAGAWFLVFPFWLINKDSWETAQKRIAESSSDALKVAEG
jgi:formate/nitrite transporter FocA (FNT family)